MRRRWPGDGHRLRAPVLSEAVTPDGAPEPYARVDLVRWSGPVDPDDPDANFKGDVATYAQARPLVTVTNLAEALDVPVGALVHYVLARWAAAGSEAVLEVGPSTITELSDVAAAAEAEGTDAARLAAFQQLRQRLAWLRLPVDEPDRVFDPVDDAPDATG